MTIYNPAELVEGGIASATKVKGKITLSIVQPGNYGDQHVIKMEEGAEILEAGDAGAVGPCKAFTEWYNPKTSKNAVWADILKAYIAAGIPLPDGPVGKVVTLQKTRFVKGINKDTGEEMASEKFIPIAVENTGGVAKAPVTAKLAGPSKITSPLLAKRQAAAK